MVSLLSQLKAETQAAHDEIEVTVDMVASLSSLARYRGLLERFHGFHASWDPRIEAALADPAFAAPRRKLPLLLRDLRVLGPEDRIASLPVCAGLPPMRTRAAELGRLAATGIDLIGLDPSMTLTYRSEYAQALPGRDVPRVQLVQEWLAGRLEGLPRAPERETYWLLPHCTERTTAQPAVAAWSRVFDAFGLELSVLFSGCCGMAGTYGHEAEHRAMSERIYGLSWAKHVSDKGRSGRLLADGYSCRSQAKLIDGLRLPHPVSVLRAHLPAGHEAAAKRSPAVAQG